MSDPSAIAIGTASDTIDAALVTRIAIVDFGPERRCWHCEGWTTGLPRGGSRRGTRGNFNRSTGPIMEYTLAEMLQRNISESAMSAAEISQVTGVESVTLRNFMRGEDIPLSAAQKLINHFGNITIARRSS